jgi:DNA-binding SARP family transcriptional activator
MQAAKGGDRVSELRLALLGPPRVDRDGGPVEVDTRKAIALLAYVAVAGGWQSREGIAALLWPDYDRTHARGALRRTLSVLNRALAGGDWLQVERAAVRLDTEHAWFDVRRCSQLLAACAAHGHPVAEVCARCVDPLAEAVALHRGDFLAGFSLRDSDSFDEWQSFQADGLRRELAGALDRLTRGLAGTGRWEEAVAAARRWLALDPLHEPAHQRLMRLYAWSGQRAAALRQYRACVRVLDDELGVAPLEDTTALYQAILENRVDPPAPLTAAGAATGAGAGARAEAGAGAGAGVEAAAGEVPPLVGRSAQWAALAAAYERAAPDGHLVVLEGEAGIGKTRLAEDFLAAARARGAVTLAGRCYDEEAGLAYGPFVEVLRAAARRPGTGSAASGPGDWAGGVGGHWLAEAARLVPELAMGRPDLPPAPPPGSPGAPGRFLEGLSQVLLAALAGPEPGVLLLDDLHWADEASLDVLTYVVRRLAARPVCIVATWREEQVPRSHRLRRLAAETERAGAATVVRLDRLTEADVGELVRSVAPDSAGAAGDLWRETEGLPFFLMEYLAALASPAAGGTGAGGDAAADGPAPGAGPVPGGVRELVPGGVRELVRSRLATVSGTGWQLLTTAAVIGRSFDLETLREASGRGDDETVTALEELAGLGLVGEVAGARAAAGGPVVHDFGHDKVRAIVYDETSLARRRLLHRRVAEALAGRSRGSQRDTVAALVAHHLQLAGDEPGAAAAFAAAGAHARALYANQEALGHFRAALALGHPDPAGLHEAIGDLETLVGDYDAARASYETAAARCDPGRLAGLEQKLGGLHHRRGDWDAAESHFEAALSALGDEGGAAHRASVLAEWSETARRRGRPDRALDLAGQALDLASLDGDSRALAQAHNALGVLRSGLGDADAARRHLEQSLTLAETLADPSARVAASNNLALALGRAGRLDAAIRLEEAALALCTTQGDRHREAALHNNLADLLHAAGRAEEARDHVRQGVAIFAEVGEADPFQPELWKLVQW